MGDKGGIKGNGERYDGAKTDWRIQRDCKDYERWGGLVGFMKFILAVMPLFLTYKLLRYTKDYDERKTREEIERVKSKDNLRGRILKDRWGALKVNKYTLNKKRFDEKVEPLIESRVNYDDMMIVSLKTVNPQNEDEGVVIPYE